MARNERKAHPLRWLPTALTLLRLTLLPVLVLALERVPDPAGPGHPRRLGALTLYVLIALTDWLDGRLARRFHATSVLGGFADAAADRFLILVPLLYLALARPPAFTHVPVWLPGWIILLDVLLGLVWLRTRGRPAGLPAVHNLSGRVAVWILAGSVVWAVAGLPGAGLVLRGTLGAGLATVSCALHARRRMAG
jgi:phosphatidylglycerophosphate synthase